MAEGFDLLSNANRILLDLKERYRSLPGNELKRTILETTISYVIRQKYRSLTIEEKGPFANEWGSYANLEGASLLKLTLLDCSCENFARLARDKITDNGYKTAADWLIQFLLEMLDEVYEIVLSRFRTYQVGYQFALLHLALEIFEKYHVCGLTAASLSSERNISAIEQRLFAPIQESIQKLTDCGIINSKIKESHERLLGETGWLLFSYADMLFNNGSISEAQNYSKNALEICLDSKYDKVVADSYNLLGRISMAYSDDKSRFEAADYFAGSIKILKNRIERGYTDLIPQIIADYVNLANVYIDLYTRFQTNPPPPRDFIALAEENVSNAEDLKAGNTMLFNTKTSLMLIKGDLEGARSVWQNLIEEYQAKIGEVLKGERLLDEEEQKVLKVFIAAVRNLVSLYFNNKIASWASINTLRDYTNQAIESLKKFPKLNDDPYGYSDLLGYRAKLSYELEDYSDAYSYHKMAQAIISERLRKTPSLLERMNIIKRYEDLFQDFVDCCYQLMLLEPNDKQQYIGPLYFVMSRAKDSLFSYLVAFEPLKRPTILKEGHKALFDSEDALITQVKRYLLTNPSTWSPTDYIKATQIMLSLEGIWKELSAFYPEYVSIRHATSPTFDKVIKML